MRLVALVGVLVAGAVAAFAIYTFGWRENTGGRSEAAAAASQIVCSGSSGTCETVTGLHRVTGDIWRFRMGGFRMGEICVTVDLSEFRMTNDGQRVDGAARSLCD